MRGPFLKRLRSSSDQDERALGLAAYRQPSSPADGFEMRRKFRFPKIAQRSINSANLFLGGERISLLSGHEHHQATMQYNGLTGVGILIVDDEPLLRKQFAA